MHFFLRERRYFIIWLKCCFFVRSLRFLARLLFSLVFYLLHCYRQHQLYFFATFFFTLLWIVCVCAFFSSSFDSLNLIVFFFCSFSLSFVSILNVSVFFSIPFNYKYHWRVLIRIVVYCTIFLLCKQKKNARARAHVLSHPNAASSMGKSMAIVRLFVTLIGLKHCNKMKKRQAKR